MSFDQQQHGQAPDHRPQQRVRPRLDLPRFEFAPSRPSTHAPSPATAPPQPQPAFSTPRLATSRPAPARVAIESRAAHPNPHANPHTNPQSHPHAQTFASAPAMRPPAPATYAPAPSMQPPAPARSIYAPSASTPAPVPYAAAPMPATTIAATPTRPATSISWDRLDTEPAPRTVLDRITPRNMGVLLVVAVVIMIMTSGPAAMKTPTTNRLPALAEGGGMMPVQPRAGSTAVDAATSAAATTAATKAAAAKPAATAARPRTIKRAGGLAPDTIDVVGVSMSANAQHGGIPSMEASARLAVVDGGGAVPADDGVTLPTSAERDSHGAERRIDGGGAIDDVLPATPVMTPGQSAKVAEEAVAAPAGSTPPPNTIAAF